MLFLGVFGDRIVSLRIADAVAVELLRDADLAEAQGESEKAAVLREAAAEKAIETGIRDERLEVWSPLLLPRRRPGDDPWLSGRLAPSVAQEVIAASLPYDVEHDVLVSDRALLAAVVTTPGGERVAIDILDSPRGTALVRRIKLLATELTSLPSGPEFSGLVVVTQVGAEADLTSCYLWSPRGIDIKEFCTAVVKWNPTESPMSTLKFAVDMVARQEELDI
jgi:hypothetical protein